MCAYAHEKINILVSVLSIVCFFIYDFNQITQGFVYLKFVKYQLGRHRNAEMQCMHVCYTVVLYTDMSKLCFYIEKKSSVFPMLGLIKLSTGVRTNISIWHFHDLFRDIGYGIF